MIRAASACAVSFIRRMRRRRDAEALQFVRPRELIGHVRHRHRRHTGAQRGVRRSRAGMMHDSGASREDELVRRALHEQHAIGRRCRLTRRGSLGLNDRAAAGELELAAIEGLDGVCRDARCRRSASGCRTP